LPGETGTGHGRTEFNMTTVWPIGVVIIGIAFAITFGFDVAGVATRVARSNDPVTRGLWRRLPAPWSSVTRPSYWRLVGVEVGVILILLGTLSAIALAR
jgi:hypothetical protein